jgi:hypothetical protein
MSILNQETNLNQEKKLNAETATKVYSLDSIPESVYWNTYIGGGALALLGCVLLFVKRGK